MRQLLHAGGCLGRGAGTDGTGLDAAARHELCRAAGYPVWHRERLAAAFAGRYRAVGAGHPAGGGAAGTPASGAGAGGCALHRRNTCAAGGRAFGYAGDPCSQKPAAGGQSGGAGSFHQRRPWRFRGKHSTAMPAQALLLCALRAGRPLCQAPEPEGGFCPAARRRGRRFAG